MNLFNFLKPKIIVATHNGSFHADDVFACATLSIWAKKNGKRIKVVRTRDPEIINKADIVVDVGMEYDPDRNRFDHHQKGGAGTHENGIPYASFGLIWKHYGEKICDKEVAKIIESKLVVPIDAIDNGINIYTPIHGNLYEYSIGDALDTLIGSDENKLQSRFGLAVQFAIEIINGEIGKAKFKVEGNKKTRTAIKMQNSPEILILEKYIYWKEAVIETQDTKFVIYPDRDGSNWCVQTVRNDPNDFNTDRAKLPENWRGLRDTKLKEISGIKDSIFCHKDGYFGVAGAKEAAVEMAQKALDVLQ